jgi:tetratricopeptide (TPR) repeat protein
VGGRYRVLRYLSQGGMGEVYEAQDLDLTEKVALKTLLPAIAEDESMVARFKREIALSRKIAHPNVCRVFDLARHAGDDGRSVVFLSMEFLAGETLEARVRASGAMKESEALPLLRQMAGALDASHRAGVIHRDFKPSNVMLVPGRDGERAVVTDFGLARPTVAADDTTATMSRVVMGTVDYMAPELLAGGAPTFASDVYALGMVAYKMLTGSLPFAGQTPIAGAILRSQGVVPSPRAIAGELDERWERAILRALSVDAGRRYASGGEFVEALRDDEPPAARPEPKWPVTRRWAIAALALVGSAAALWRWSSAGSSLAPEAEALYRKGVADNAAGAWFAATKALGEAVKLAPGAAQVHARLAEAWVGLDMPEQAAKEMLLARRQDISKLPATDRLRIEAIDLSITRDFAAAAAKYRELARRAPGSAEVDVDLGRACENANLPDEAIESYRRGAEGPEHNPAAWLRLGTLYARQSNEEKSAAAFAQAELLYQFTSNLEGLTEVSLQRGIAENGRGHLEAGAAFLRKALDTARLTGNPQEEIGATIRLSTNAFLSGDSAEADRLAREALDNARSHHLEALAIRGLVNLGSAFSRRQDFVHAEQNYREALDLSRQTGSAHLAALSLLSLASLHDQTDRKEAVQEAQEALTFYRANRYAKESLQCLTIMARAQRDAGDYDGALISFRGLLQFAEGVRDHAQLSLAHESIGSMLFQEDRYPEALDEYRKALEFATDAEHKGYAELDCGNTLWRLGRFDEAAAAFAQADTYARNFVGLRLQTMCGRAGMALSQRRFRDAAEIAREALGAHLAPTPAVQAEVDEILGLAMVGLGNTGEGVRKCEAARAATEAAHDTAGALPASVAALEARVEAGARRPSALEDFESWEPRLAAKPELRWRALAWAAQADPRYLAPAREALPRLSRLWGEAAYRSYLTRPDVAKLSGPVLRGDRILQ